MLRLVVKGEPNKAIAAKLHTSEKTVERDCKLLMQELEVFDRAGLIREAVQQGLAL